MTPSDTHTDPVRVALVGLGGHGRTIQAASDAAPGLAVAAVYDPVADEAEAAAEHFGCDAEPSFEALLARDDLDAVALVSPNFVHRAQAEAAFAAGLDVFVEKPIANTVADGLAMIEHAEAGGRLLMVGHNMRFRRTARRVKAIIDAGQLGDVATMEFHFSSDSALRLPPDAWRLRQDQCPLLPMMQLGIHGIDLVHYFLGPIREVYARARAVTTRDGVVDSIVATFGIDGGPHGALVSNYCSPVRFDYYLAGTEGALAGTAHTLVFTSRTGEVVEQHDESATPMASYTAQMQAFAESVRTRRTPETDGWSGVRALAVVEAMTDSIAQRAAVDVPVFRSQMTPTHHE